MTLDCWPAAATRPRCGTGRQLGVSAPTTEVARTARRLPRTSGCWLRPSPRWPMKPSNLPRSCQIHLTGPSGTDDTSGGVLAVSSPTVRVHISVAAWFGTDLLSATARMRQMIFTAAEDLLGLPVTTVDVDVVDVFDDPRRRP